MATFFSSVANAIGCCCIKCESKESLNLQLMGATRKTCKIKASTSSERLVFGRKLFMRDVADVVMRFPRQNVDLRCCATSRVSVDQTEHLFSTSTQADERQKLSTYRFRAEGGGQVKVSVSRRSGKCVVCIEVSFFELSKKDEQLLLSWGTYRSDRESVIRAGEAPLVPKSFGALALELEFQAKESPFCFSFLLKPALDGKLSNRIIKSHRNTDFCVPVGFDRGNPDPLGLSFSNDGSVNFAVFSRNATGMVLCFYEDTSSEKPALELDLDPYVNRTGDIWHASFDGAWNFASYGYKCRGDGEGFHPEHVCLDPYAKIIVSSIPNRDKSGLLTEYLGRLCKEPDFDWTGDVRPNLMMEKLVVYRLNVMCFTDHKSSKLPADVSGTFSGVSSKVHHLKDLGVNAVLLEPILTFDEQRGPYFPHHFFSPTSIYGPPNGPVSAINTMKDMVKKLHSHGIEVLLEVVYPYTAEAGAFQGIDDLSYYYMNKAEGSGQKSVLNCNYPIVQHMILPSLRYLVTEFHIDGFCFINASFLLRGFHGEHLSRPPLVEAITFDPLLSKTKIIADNWDPRDMRSKEVKFPHWKRWAEMNSKFCVDVRNFLRGEGLISDLATRLCGSGDIFLHGRGPAFSLNYVAKNFGLTLVDLVSFSNTELAFEHSWNCGEEGPTTKTAVLERRLKQIRNFLFVLFVSQGVPVINMGDECGQSSGGSPSRGSRKPLDWNALSTGFGIQTTQFISFFSSLRSRRGDIFQRINFLKEESIEWHGWDQSPPPWDDPSYRFLAMKLKAERDEESSPETSPSEGDLFIAFNADGHSEAITLPQPPEGMAWCRLVDTALPFPGFFSTGGVAVFEQMVGSVKYQVKPHSCVMFEAKVQVVETTRIPLQEDIVAS